MSKVITAEEQFELYSTLYALYEAKAGEFENLVNEAEFKDAIIEFAKLYVQAQTEAILERLELRGEHNNIDKNIIINAYPLTKIK